MERQRRSTSASSSSLAQSMGGGASAGPAQPPGPAPSAPVTTSSAVPVGHQQQTTTTRVPAHSLQHCHPATGRSPRSELLLLPQQSTATTAASSLAPPPTGSGRQNENLRRHSEAPPTSLPLLQPHSQHSHNQHLHGRQQLHSLAPEPGQSRPQRIVESLRRATMVGRPCSLNLRRSMRQSVRIWGFISQGDVSVCVRFVRIRPMKLSLR